LQSTGLEQKEEVMVVSWEQLREIFYRRNIVVHNDGKINKEYTMKMKGGNEDEFLSSDKVYVNKSILVFTEYGQFIFDKMVLK
jgi:hypothetical protein